MKIICSTLSAPHSICITQKMPNGQLKVVKKILVNGGANVCNKRTLLTPYGVTTELEDKDFEQLKETDWYKRMEKRGFVRVVDHKDAAEDPESIGMESADNGKQMNEDDLQGGIEPEGGNDKKGKKGKKSK